MVNVSMPRIIWMSVIMLDAFRLNVTLCCESLWGVSCHYGERYVYAEWHYAKGLLSESHGTQVPVDLNSRFLIQSY
jgi:hypothetical protein